jgi:hypothetical protein
MLSSCARRALFNINIVILNGALFSGVKDLKLIGPLA